MKLQILLPILCKLLQSDGAVVLSNRANGTDCNNRYSDSGTFTGITSSQG